MMTMLVLGLDAADPEIISAGSYPNLELRQSRSIETVSWMRDEPYTLEVWPTIATGLHPRDHGITREGTSDWENPVVDFISNFTGMLPESVRGSLGHTAKDIAGQEYSIATTDEGTMFDNPGYTVHNWPGVYRNEYLTRIWDTLNPDEDDQTKKQFEREVFGTAAEQFGWLEEMLNHDIEVAGVHIHTLDICGHVYARDRENLKRAYQKIDRMVERLREEMGGSDELLIVSDHGMCTAWFDGEKAGEHRDSAFASTTIGTPLFEDVLHVREWIEKHANARNEIKEEKIEYDEEHLRDLGYI